jgi:chromate transporter
MDQVEEPVRPSALQLLSVFLRVGFTAFGGSTSAWMHRAVVEHGKWISDEDFLTGLAVAQVLPGANPVNMALYLGMKLRGGVGAVMAVVGMVTPAFSVILLLGYFYRQFGSLPATHAVLAGVAAAGVGATLSVGVKVARRLPGNAIPIGIALVTFVTIGVLHWHMVPVVCVLVPISILSAYWMQRSHTPGRETTDG